MQQTLPWVLAISACVLLAAAGLLWWASRRRPRERSLPADWALASRPVFSSDERRVYRQLREALPHHIILAKLPLVRFCQPTDPGEVRYWYELLGATHVSFAICSANGRVLAAIDLEAGRGNSRRVQHIKESVLGACRVRYLHCPIDRLPSIPELQLLVPQTVPPLRTPQPAAPAIDQARDNLVSTVASRRRQRSTLWQDSGFFGDSFFGAELRGGEPPSAGDVGGVVVDGPPPQRH